VLAAHAKVRNAATLDLIKIWDLEWLPFVYVNVLVGTLNQLLVLVSKRPHLILTLYAGERFWIGLVSGDVFGRKSKN